MIGSENYHGPIPILDEQMSRAEGGNSDRVPISPRRIHPQFGTVNYAEFGRMLTQSATEPFQDYSTIVTEEWKRLPEALTQRIDDGTIVHSGPEPEQPLPMPAMGQGRSRIDHLRVGGEPRTEQRPSCSVCPVATKPEQST